jgi:hypothetical protein
MEKAVPPGAKKRCQYRTAAAEGERERRQNPAPLGEEEAQYKK